ncbi:hypothetical protein SAG0109_06795 [Streptococcus agalactiae BSU108]|nr:hypothetical protein SAG0109_06795 [Streptococcus agalactiae BSU108]
MNKRIKKKTQNQTLYRFTHCRKRIFFKRIKQTTQTD